MFSNIKYSVKAYLFLSVFPSHLTKSDKYVLFPLVVWVDIILFFLKLSIFVYSFNKYEVPIMY